MQEMEAVRPDYPERTKTKSNDGQESMFTAAEQPGTTGGLTDAVSERSDATAALHFYCCSSLTSHNLIASPSMSSFQYVLLLLSAPSSANLFDNRDQVRGSVLKLG